MFENNMLENIQSMRLVNPDNPWHNCANDWHALVAPQFKQFLNELAGNDTNNETTEEN